MFKISFIFLALLLLTVVLTASEQDLYQNAMSLFQSKDYEQALSKFDQFCRQYPKHSYRPAAEFYGIKCYYLLEQYEIMEQKIEELRKREPNHPALDDLEFLQIEIRIKQNRWDDVIPLLAQYGKKYPQSSYLQAVQDRLKVSYYNSAKYEYQKGNFPKVIRDVEAFLKSHPTHPSRDDLEFLRGLAFLGVRKYDEALQVFKNFVKVYPESPYTEMISASVNKSEYHPLMVFHNIERYEDFLKESEAFRETHPKDPFCDDLMFWEILSLKKLQRWADALERANNLVAQYPASPYVKKMGGKDGRTENQAAEEFDKGDKAYHKNEYQKSIQIYRDFIRNYPNNWRLEDACHHLCYALYHSKDREKFYEECDNFINQFLDSNFVDDILYVKCSSLVQEKKGAQARSLLDFIGTRYPHTSLKNTLIQLRLESYLFLDNVQDLPQIKEEWPTIEDLIHECFLLAAQMQKETWFKKNLSMAEEYFKQTGQPEKAVQLYKNLQDVPMPRDWTFSLKEKTLLSLVNAGIYEEAETLGKLYLSDEALSEEQKKVLSQILTRNYAVQGRMEEAGKIYESYHLPSGGNKEK